MIPNFTSRGRSSSTLGVYLSERCCSQAHQETVNREINSLTYNKQVQQKNSQHVWSFLKSHMII